MRLLVLGHLSHTGFGIVTESLGGEFVARGIDVRVLAVNHRGEPIRGPLAGRVWPANMLGEGFGANIIPAAIDGSFWRGLDPTDDWRPDLMLVISDMTGFMSHIGRRLSPQWLTIPVFHYMPVEGDNFPRHWGELWNAPASHQTVSAEIRERFAGVAFHPVAMSDYGARVIGDLTGRTIPRIYHGVDTETFRPVTRDHPVTHEGKVLRSRAECRAVFGFAPDEKIILRTDRNVTRKFYYAFVAAMAEVIARDRSVRVVIHCQPMDPADNLNMYEELARVPFDVMSRFGFTNAHDTFRGLPAESLVALMNAADLYVSTTGGEGFGLTLAESLACEVPVVVTDWAADRETVGPGGILVPPTTNNRGEPVRFHSQYGMDWALPDAAAFVEPVLSLLAKPHRRQAMGEAGRRHVVRSFRWSEAADQFVSLFDAALVPAEVAA